DRAFDLAGCDAIRIKLRSAENFAQDRPHLEVVDANAFSNRSHYIFARFVFDKKAPEFAADELRTGRLPEENVDDVVAIQISALAHECLCSVILLKWCKSKLLRCHVDPITGECTGRFANVL